eukprot:6492678-Amphidinium_carterae.2
MGKHALEVCCIRVETCELMINNEVPMSPRCWKCGVVVRSVKVSVWHESLSVREENHGHMSIAGWKAIACAAELGSSESLESGEVLQAEVSIVAVPGAACADSVVSSWLGIAASAAGVPRVTNADESGSSIPVVCSGSLVCRPSESQDALGEALAVQEKASYIILEQLAVHGAGRVPALMSYERTRLQGHNLGPPSSAAMVWCAEQAKHRPGERDTDYMKLARYYLENASAFHVASVASRSAELGISDKVLEVKLCRLASAQLCYGRVCRSLLEERVCQAAHVVPIAYSEFVAYDETPLKAGVKPLLVSPIGAHPVQLQLSGMGASDALAMQKLCCSLRQEAIISKIMQCHQGYGMVLDCGPKYGFIKVVGVQVCPLQSLERNTSEAVCLALLKQSNSSTWSDQFQLRALVTARDKASSNAKAEKRFLSDMRVPWAHLPLHCHVTGLINVGLSLRVAGSLTAFRFCLREVILESLEFKRGEPSGDAKRFKRIVLDAFATRRSKNVQQLLLLSLLPNGDWRSSKVEHYVDHDASSEDYPKIASKLEAGLIQALLCRKPKTWARHRWGGCEVAIEELGLLEA